MNQLAQLIEFLTSRNAVNDKAVLTKEVVEMFALRCDHSVYSCDAFAIRFSSASKPGKSFSNTILSLSKLQKYDHIPFLVCMVTPELNHVRIANSTFLKKVSQTSQHLRVDNIRGSFNYSDIMQEFDGITNCPENLEELFAFHCEIGFQENLPRLVEATNRIVPSGRKFPVPPESEHVILDAPARAVRFAASEEAVYLKQELDEKVARYRDEILVASMIENVNIRGRVIEYLIAGRDESLRAELVRALLEPSVTKGIPAFKTDNTLGDYQRVFDAFFTETDVKTKIMALNSNPKAYNLDKMLEFLSKKKSVFLFYFVGMDLQGDPRTVLVSMFQRDLLASTRLLTHWSGRNSRGVSMFEGKTIERLLAHPDQSIDMDAAGDFLRKVIDLQD